MRSFRVSSDASFFFHPGKLSTEPSDLFVEFRTLFLIVLGVLLFACSSLEDFGQRVDGFGLPLGEECRVYFVLGCDLCEGLSFSECLEDYFGFECRAMLLSHGVFFGFQDFLKEPV